MFTYNETLLMPQTMPQTIFYPPVGVVRVPAVPYTLKSPSKSPTKIALKKRDLESISQISSASLDVKTVKFDLKIVLFFKEYFRGRFS
jgi:hypothetical protein